MKDPMVSIIIPVYNGSNFMSEAIDSALSQTYNNIEVIVVNDGSLDDGATERIALSYGDKIRYYKKENGGVSTALNLGIRSMKGEYFSWLSHDDLYYPDKIKSEIEALGKSGDMRAVIYSDFHFKNESTGRTYPSNLYWNPQYVTNLIAPLIKGYVGGCTLLIHKSHFDKHGMFDESLRNTQDYVYWYKLFKNEKIIFLNEPTTVTRIHGRQGTQINPDYAAECSQLYLNFARNVSKGDQSTMFGSPYVFYHEILNRLLTYGQSNQYREVCRMFMNEPIPEGLDLEGFHRKIIALTHGQAKRICIFCAGAFGIRLYHNLKNRLVDIDCFADNSPSKQGYLFEGKSCISLEKLKELGENTLIIVANQSPDDIVSQLRDEGFKYVATKQELDPLMDEYPPLKWPVGLDALDDVDYTSSDVQKLSGHFNRLVYDICKYYEDRV